MCGALEESTLNGNNGDSDSGNDTEELHFRQCEARRHDEKLLSFIPSRLLCRLCTADECHYAVIMLPIAVINIMPDTEGKAIH
jgi:hypothetical protein